MTLDGPAETVLRAQADSLAAAGDLHGAIAGYVRLIDAVTSSRPAPEEDLRDAAGMSRLYATLAGLYHRAGKEADARPVAARRTALWQHWDRKLPGNAFVRRQLASR